MQINANLALKNSFTGEKKKKYVYVYVYVQYRFFFQQTCWKILLESLSIPTVATREANNSYRLVSSYLFPFHLSDLDLSPRTTNDIYTYNTCMYKCISTLMIRFVSLYVIYLLFDKRETIFVYRTWRRRCDQRRARLISQDRIIKF